MDADSALSIFNLSFLEALSESFDRDPSSVDPAWHHLFRNGYTGAAEVSDSVQANGDLVAAIEKIELQNRVDALIAAYRLHGHLRADVDPLGRPHSIPAPQLELDFHRLDESHLGRYFHSSGLIPDRKAPLREIIQRLRNTYCRHVAVEYWHINNPEQRAWLRQQMESCENKIVPSVAEQRQLLSTLAHVEDVDLFLHNRFVGAKRFSAAGAESTICFLDALIEAAGAKKIGEVIIGMAHRGRLNVLMNVLGKSPAEVFSEFGNTDPHSYLGAGDVKYHQGYYREHVTRAGDPIYLAVAFNPSHLEAITPVIQGRVRAKQDEQREDVYRASLGVTIHGDAAFSGQGVVMETLNMTGLRGYTTGGSIRLVINNQVGFTTDPSDSRTGTYCTDPAHLLQVPIFHINGDDPEAAAYVARLALEWRTLFQKDVIIDLICYRKYGHNEGDDPTFTQPQMYRHILNHASVRQRYQDELLARGTVTADDCSKIKADFASQFAAAFEAMRAGKPKPAHTPLHGPWQGYHGGLEADAVEVQTCVEPSVVERLAPRMFAVPGDFSLHPKIERFLSESTKMLSGETELNWATGELLAYATLLDAGTPIRMTGQDIQRGTFSHRHAVFTDSQLGHKWCPLANLHANQGRFSLYNSPLSEFGVLGFEFGYSLIAPHALVIWEAQFGDFANGAQVIIDQFLSSSEDKWNRLSGLVLMLPHGFEGQGPEHSSARLERFLQMCAEDNMQVCNLTTPAQLFHALRRQVLRAYRKPLVLMSPKSLLRFRPSFSPLSDFTSGAFHRVIDDLSVSPAAVKRIILCSGKIFYDLDEDRVRRGLNNVALVRVEQLHPLPRKELIEVFARLHQSAAVDLLWVQEEPENMGAWQYMRGHLDDFPNLPARLRYVGRYASSSPATGSLEAHKLETQAILDAAFDGLA
jgi:2-oxoglutarate dehydrogenase E1 component